MCGALTAGLRQISRQQRQQISLCLTPDRATQLQHQLLGRLRAAKQTHPQPKGVFADAQIAAVDRLEPRIGQGGHGAGLQPLAVFAVNLQRVLQILSPEILRHQNHQRARTSARGGSCPGGR